MAIRATGQELICCPNGTPIRGQEGEWTKTSPPGKQQDAGGKMIQVLCLLSVHRSRYIHK